MNIIVFTQSTCAPCKRLMPHITGAATHYDIPLKEFDVAEYYEAAMFYEVMATPAAFLVDDDGGVLTRLRASTTLALIQELAQHLE